MTVTVTEVFDQHRFCGWRHERGLYIVGPALSHECGKLPFPLGECECCGQRVKLTRSLQKVDVKRLVHNVECSDPKDSCRLCLINRTETGYLIAAGHKHYKSKDIYLREAMELGISKRIAQIPHGFKVGESVVLIGYPKVFTDYVPEGAVDKPVEIDEDSPQQGLPMFDSRSDTTGRMVARDIPGVICLFQPQRIEYITDGTEDEEFLQKLVDRGITPVHVTRVVDTQLQLEHA